MERNVALEDISDGQLYDKNSFVQIGSHECAGCSECCRITADTILLDPYDLWQLARGVGMDISALMGQGYVALGVENGLILPHLDIGENGCKFLNENSRCSVHTFRPGFCRLFPLGRVYDGDRFSYFVQSLECPHMGTDGTSVRIRNWIGIPTSEFYAYETFISRWHKLQREALSRLAEAGISEEEKKQINLQFLTKWFFAPWDGSRDFYEQFEERITG